jgi:conjugative transposon TraM protein
MKSYSEKFKKQRKFLLVLPLLALPFITMAFWALGGGHKVQPLPQKEQQAGFNTELPEAKLPTGNLDKMSLYRIAEQDSQALREARMQDPYARYDDTQTNSSANDTNTPVNGPSAIYSDGYDSYTGMYSNPDPNEVKVRRKLAQLENALNTPPADTDIFSVKDLTEPSEIGSADSMEAKLEQLMSGTQQQGSTDPELKQLDGMLEKILDIQHPGRIQQQLKAQSEKQRGQAFPVTTTANAGTASLLQRPFIPDLPDDSVLSFASSLQLNAFYDLTQPASQDNLTRQAIPAVVHETQTLVSGATVKLRLMQDVYIAGTLIPKNTFVYGSCTVTGERLDIQVKDIRYGNHIFPVSLTVFDMDGLEGIRVPGAITRDAVKEGTDQAIQGLQLMDMNPSLGAQAAGAGVEAIKGLLGRKAKLVQVTVKAGYPVLLVDKKSMQQ